MIKFFMSLICYGPNVTVEGRENDLDVVLWLTVRVKSLECSVNSTQDNTSADHTDNTALAGHIGTVTCQNDQGSIFCLHTEAGH